MPSRPPDHEFAPAVERVRALLREPFGEVHLLGIAGVGVAALAVQLQALGFRVTGCDSAPGRVGAWLESLGIPVRVGHDPAHGSAALRFAVRSPAVHVREPECAALARAGVPLFARGAVLPAVVAARRGIAVGGTHGKTTTTAMIAHALRANGVDAGYCIGGDAPGLGLAAAGSSPWLVVEADESDGTLALYDAEIAVVTNAEMDHVDYFATFDALAACFAAFASRARRLVYCGDDAGARAAARHAQAAVSFGFDPGCEWSARAIVERPGAIAAIVTRDGRDVAPLALGAPGRTNLLDALAAIAACAETGVDPAAACCALASFRPVRRRFDVLCDAGGIRVISDYAHHPTEIRAVLDQAKTLAPERVLAVFQPHRYTRTKLLGPAFPPSFAGVDELWLVPVYAASEDPVDGGTTADLAREFHRLPGVPVHVSQSLLEAWEEMRQKCRSGDVILVVGAGDVDVIAAWAAAEFGRAG